MNRINLISASISTVNFSYVLGMTYTTAIGYSGV